VTAGALGIHAIGRGLAAAKGLQERHAIKQVDRLVGNSKAVLDDLFELWVPYVMAGRVVAKVNLDWTEFDDDDQSMLVASLQTKHGRATPLLWKTVIKSELKDQRNASEDELLIRLRQLIPLSVRVTIVADRGFGDQQLYDFLQDLRFDYLIRFRGNIMVTSAKAATSWSRAPREKRGWRATGSVKAAGCACCATRWSLQIATRLPWCSAYMSGE